jgi:MtN3 and saliva related transmembrane protein
LRRIELSAGEIIGLIGGAFTTFAFVPQVIRVLRLKSAREISLVFSVLFVLGGGCWLTYGLLLQLPVVVFWNSIAVVLASVLLVAKIRYGKRPVPVAGVKAGLVD